MKITKFRVKTFIAFSHLLIYFVVLIQVNGQSPKPIPAVMEVPFAPIPVKAMGKTNLVYELHITNFSRSSLVLTGVEILADDSQKTSLAVYRDAELLKRLVVISGTAETQEKNVIGAGQRAIVFLMISNDASNIPTALRHRLFFKSIETPNPTNTTATDNNEQTLDGMRVTVQNEKPVVIGSPVRGRWIAVNGLSNDTGHRRSIIPINGQAQIAQRFATDWVKLGDDGLIVRNNDYSKNENYDGYGDEALAVADGVIVDVKNGITENVPQTKERAVPITLETVAGNYVLLDIGNGHFALYAHLQPNSLKVKVGDKVKKGEALGLVGNSGNSDLPHLHFHIVNAASPLAAEGVPYVIESFTMQGIFKTTPEAVKSGFKVDSSAESKRQMELPLQNAVVVFP